MNKFSFSPPTDKWTNTLNEKRKVLRVTPVSGLSPGVVSRSLARCDNLERWPKERRRRASPVRVASASVTPGMHAEPRRDIMWNFLVLKLFLVLPLILLHHFVLIRRQDLLQRQQIVRCAPHLQQQLSSAPQTQRKM